MKISIVTIHYPYRTGKYLWNGIDVHAVGAANKTSLRKPLIWKKAVEMIIDIDKISKVDLIHSLWLRECALLGNVAISKIGAAHICTCMGTELNEWNIYLKLISKDKVHFVCVSSMQQSILLNRLSSCSSTVIPWGYGTRYSDEADHNSRSNDILFVGNISPVKDLPLFIEICKDLKKERQEFTAMIIGDNVMRLNMDDIIVTNSLEKNVKYMGAQSNSVVQGSMKRSRILVHTSSFESFGYVFLEALANGMRIVSKQVGIAKEGSNWRIVKKRNEFVNEIIDLLERDGEYEVSIPYPVAHTVDKYLELYRSRIK